MRSSNYKHSNQLRHMNKSSRARKTTAKKSRFGSFVITAFILVAAVVVPSAALIQNVQAAGDVKKNVLSVGGSTVFSDVIADSDKGEKENKAEKTRQAS